VIRSSQS